MRDGGARWRHARRRWPRDDGGVLRLALALFALQAGFHGFTASLPVALSRAGVPDPQIGLIVGVAALVQVPAAFLAGVIVDRLGGPADAHDRRAVLPRRLRDPHAAGRRAGRAGGTVHRRPDLPGDRHRRDAAGGVVARPAPDRTRAARLRPGVHGQRPQPDARGDPAALAGRAVGHVVAWGRAGDDDLGPDRPRPGVDPALPVPLRHGGGRPRRAPAARGSPPPRLRVPARLGTDHRDRRPVHRPLGGHRRLPSPARGGGRRRYRPVLRGRRRGDPAQSRPVGLARRPDATGAADAGRAGGDGTGDPAGGTPADDATARGRGAAQRGRAAAS